MKYIKFIAILSFIIFGMMACRKDFLTVPDTSRLFVESYVTDLKTTSEYMNGIYTNLAYQIYHGNNLIYPDLISDNIKPVTGSARFGIRQYTWNQQADILTQNIPEKSTLGMNPIWLTGYKLIRGCNLVIERSEQYKNEDPAKAAVLQGEAYAIRALVHFWIANIFAQSYNFTSDAQHIGIPYIKTSDWTSPVSRQNVAEIYINLIEDLDNAINLLPDFTNSTLRINRNAAKALLARVYLFKGDYDAAKNLAVQVVKAVPIMTVNYPDKLYTLQETEALFQLPPDIKYATEFAGLFFTPNYIVDFLATNDIATILKENLSDKRAVWVTQVSGNWRILKFTDSVVSGYPYPQGAYYQTVIRSSEMSLTAAEAFARIGNEDSAKFYVDAIRKRANVFSPNLTATGKALLDTIYKERRKELAFEGLRMFDLLRWKQGVNRIDVNNSSAQHLPYPSDKAIAPVPSQDVDLAGLTQNVGY